MASARQITRLVTTTGRISSGAVRTAMGRTETPKGGLGILPDLLSLLAETVIGQSGDTGESVEKAGSYIARLVLRYGTVRRAIEALASGRRRHALISAERARAWEQVLTVSPSAIHSTLTRHAWLRIHLSKWITDHNESIDQRLADFEAWFDGPLPGSDGEEDCPLLQQIAAQTVSAPAATPLSEQKPQPADTAAVAPADLDAEPVVTADGGISMSDTAAPAGDVDEADLALVAGLLDDKRPGDWAGEWQLREHEEQAAQRLFGAGDPLAKAVGALALKKLSLAGDFAQEIPKANMLERETRLGDQAYMSGNYDRATDHYRAARRLSDDDIRRRNLALALLRRDSGVRDDHLREALDLLTQTVSDQPAGSRTRGCALVVLGLAWSAMPTRDRDHALHESVRCFQQAASIFDPKDDADWWAEARLHLAHTWIEMPTGDRFENVEHAIGSLRQAEKVWSRESAPERWASVQNAMGHAWERLPTDNRARTLEQAIRCFSAALEVRTKEDHPAHWARLQNNLGNAWIQLPAGDHTQNVERGIACHQGALSVWSEIGKRSEWAATQSNLGNAYALLPGEPREREKNMRRAIACYRSALEVRTKSAQPSEWASTQNNLGTALLHLPVQGRGATVKEAIECFTAALSVRTQETAPSEWAKTQSNLGLAWSRLPGDKYEHLGEAVACYELALEVFTADRHPSAHKHVRARLSKAKDALAAMA